MNWLLITAILTAQGTTVTYTSMPSDKVCARTAIEAVDAVKELRPNFPNITVRCIKLD